MARRELTLTEITDELLAECGLCRRGATAQSYRCTDPGAVLVPIGDILAKPRAVNPEALRRILRGFRDGDDIPPVDVFHDAGLAATHLLGGMHRWRASLAFGFVMIPCNPHSRSDAEGAFGYPSGVVGGGKKKGHRVRVACEVRTEARALGGGPAAMKSRTAGREYRAGGLRSPCAASRQSPAQCKFSAVRYSGAHFEAH